MKLVFSGSAKFAEFKNIKKKMFMFLFCFFKAKNCLILDILILNFALPRLVHLAVVLELVECDVVLARLALDRVVRIQLRLVEYLLRKVEQLRVRRDYI